MLRSFSILCVLGLALAAPAAFASGSGDCNGDGAVDAADVELARGAVGSTAGDDAFIAAADIDGDGVISLVDLSAILEASS
jgi:hypothetical protein